MDGDDKDIYPHWSEEEVPHINILDFPQRNIAIAISTIHNLLLLHPALCNVLPKSVLLLFFVHWMDIIIKGFLTSDLLYGTIMKVFEKIKIGRHIFETICLTLKANVFWLYRFFLSYFYNTYHNSFKYRV